MKRAILVLATSVALFISVAANATVRVPVPIASKGDVILGGVASGTNAVGDPAWAGPSFNRDHKTGGTLGGSDGRIGVTLNARAAVNVGSLAKNAVGAIKNNVPTVIVTSAVMWAIDQIPGASYDPVSGEMTKTSGGFPPSGEYYTVTTTGGVLKPERFGDALSACRSIVPTGSGWFPRVTQYGTNLYQCDRVYQSWYCPTCTPEQYGTVGKRTENCENGWDVSALSCSTEAQPRTPFAEADWANLEDTLRQVSDSDWIKDLLRERCEGSLSPGACYDSLVDLMPINGPSYQNGTPRTQTTTKTNPDGTTSTTKVTVNNRYDYKYGSDYFDVTTTKTTTTTKDGQTTTETTTDDTPEGQEPETETPSEDEEQPMPEISDAYKPYIDKLNDIKTDVAVAPSVVAPLGWSAWYWFGGGCSEISAELPVLGTWSTAYCPYIYDWVRPILGFLFIVFTWHYCRELWSEAVTQARPM